MRFAQLINLLVYLCKLIQLVDQFHLWHFRGFALFCIKLLFIFRHFFLGAFGDLSRRQIFTYLRWKHLHWYLMDGILRCLIDCLDGTVVFKMIRPWWEVVCHGVVLNWLLRTLKRAISIQLLRVTILPRSFKLAFSKDSLGDVFALLYLLFESGDVGIGTILGAPSIVLEFFDLIVAVSYKDLQRGAIKSAWRFRREWHTFAVVFVLVRCHHCQGFLFVC